MTTCFVATCTGKGKRVSATVAPPKAPERILYFGVNACARIEASALEKVAKVRGVVRNHPDRRKGVGWTATGLRPDLLDDGQLASFLQELLPDPNRRERLRRVLTGPEPSGKQYFRNLLGRLAQIYASVETGEIRVRRVVLSGHSSCGEFFDGSGGAYSVQDLVDISAVFPRAVEGVSHLMVSGCSTGLPELFDQFRKAFPRVKTIWAYWAKSPTGDLTSEGDSYAAEHILEWERQTRSLSAKHIDRRTIPEPKAKNVAVWSQDRGIEPKVRSLDAVRQDVFNHEQIYMDAFEGNDVTSRDLLEYYTLINELCGHRDLPSWQRPELRVKVRRTLLLRFYPSARRHFARHYGDVLQKGYAELKRPLPSYGTLSRKDAMKAIDDLESITEMGPAADTALRTLTRHLKNLDMPATWAEGGAH